eukprot:2145554-Rhodomonas_salina.2
MTDQAWPLSSGSNATRSRSDLCARKLDDERAVQKAEPVQLLLGSHRVLPHTLTLASKRRRASATRWESLRFARASPVWRVIRDTHRELGEADEGLAAHLLGFEHHDVDELHATQPRQPRNAQAQTGFRLACAASTKKV